MGLNQDSWAGSMAQWLSASLSCPVASMAKVNNEAGFMSEKACPFATVCKVSESPFEMFLQGHDV